MATTVPPTNLKALPAEPRPWTDSDLTAVRDQLKRGLGLVDIARTLRRHPEEIAAHIRQTQAAPVRLRRAR